LFHDRISLLSTDDRRPMDNLTHTLTGLLIARAGLNRVTARAAPMLVIGANLPDIDVIWAIGGSTAYLDAHRGVTHSLFLLPLLAAVPALLGGLIRRPQGFRWNRAWAVSAAGIASHLVLDWTNLYGIRLLLPQSGEFYRLDIASVVDPWILGFLALGVLWPLLARLVTSEIGARGARHGAGLSRFVLAAIAAYLGMRYFCHARAVEILSSRIYEGGAVRSVAALPSFANPLEWRGLVEQDKAWRIIGVDLRSEFDPSSGRVLFKANASAALEAARATEPFRALERFSRSLIWQTLPSDRAGDFTEVTAVDLRFAMPGEGRFAAMAVVDPQNRVVESRYQFGPPGLAPRPR
jgi:inner membrane protein